jgi:hypothetical protein
MKSKYIWEEIMMPVESARGRLNRLENARGRKFFFLLPPFFFVKTQQYFPVGT